MEFSDKAPIQVDDELIKLTCKSIDDAVRMCLQVSGRSLKEVAWDCGWRDEGRVLRRILNVNAEDADRRYMPHERWIPFMVACRNVVPLRFMALKVAEAFNRGVSDMNVSEEMRVLRMMLGEIQDEVKALRESRQGGTAFSLSGPVGIPEWLICEASMVQEMVGI